MRTLLAGFAISSWRWSSPLVVWSRASMAAALAGLAFAAASVLWRQMVYGLGS